jgi:hypothetical protein
MSRGQPICVGPAVKLAEQEKSDLVAFMRQLWSGMQDEPTHPSSLV